MRKKKKPGCFSLIAYAFTLLILVVLFSTATSGKKEDQAPPSPTPIATEAVALVDMPMDQALGVITQNADSVSWKTVNVTIDPDVVWIDADRNNDLLGDESMLIGSIRYAIDVMQEAFQLDGVPQLYFRFHENGRDSNGQQVDMITITMRITKEKADELDLDYFHEWAITKQLAFLKAIDGYSLYKDYKAIAQ